MPKNTAVIRDIYDGWGSGDFSVSVDLFDPQAVFVMRPEFPDAGTYAGREGIAQFMRGFLEPWARLTIEAEEIIEAGERIVVAVIQRGTGAGSGAFTEFRYFHVWSFRGDGVIRLESIRDRAAALQAAGLAGEDGV